MSHDPERHPTRRDFLGHLGAAAALTAAGAVPAALPAQASASPTPPARGEAPWDMSWVDRLAGVPYRVVFDSPDIADGAALDLAADFLEQFHAVCGARDDQMRAVIVIRQLAVPMAFGDALWARYPIGEDRKLRDRATGAPVRHNPFLRAPAGASPARAASTLETLHARGTILLVCNRASMNWAARMARQTGRDVEQLRDEVRSGLVPGALLMPNGIFALIRAQNAGCAYMRGA